MLPYRDHLDAHGKDLVGMIHLAALPGTPAARLAPEALVERAVEEATTYREAGFSTVMIENMHDLPYTTSVGPEVPAVMAIAAREVRRLGLYCGVQVLAGCNREALAVAHAAGCDFVRVEGFVFGHVGDEGWIESCAGELLRYRRRIGADDVMVFTDIKKKHSSHAVTADVDLVETARAAQFFCSDGVVVTGSATGEPVDAADLEALADVPIRKLVGSGVTVENLPALLPWADVFVVGSSLKEDGRWENPPEQARAEALRDRFESLLVD